MKLDVFFTPGEIGPAELPDRVIVVDVLRATSTIVEALGNGARAIFPVATADDGVRLAQNVGRDTVLLCGERRGLAIEGFDLGNAPSEFTPEAVRDQALVMTTTNGTAAFLALTERPGAVEGRSAILAGSFLNLAALVDRVASEQGGTAVVCAGREGRFALEDAICAGWLIRRLEEAGAELDVNDAGIASRSLADPDVEIEEILAATAAGRHLESIGRGEDVRFCARRDRVNAIPRLRDRKLTLE